MVCFSGLIFVHHLLPFSVSVIITLCLPHVNFFLFQRHPFAWKNRGLIPNVSACCVVYSQNREKAASPLTCCRAFMVNFAICCPSATLILVCCKVLLRLSVCTRIVCTSPAKEEIEGWRSHSWRSHEHKLFYQSLFDPPTVLPKQITFHSWSECFQWFHVVQSNKWGSVQKPPESGFTSALTFLNKLVRTGTAC